MDAQRYAGALALVRHWLPQLTIEQYAGLKALLEGYGALAECLQLIHKSG